MNSNPVYGQSATQPAQVQHSVGAAMRPNTLQPQNNLNSPISFPSQSPYHSEYSKYVVF